MTSKAIAAILSGAPLPSQERGNLPTGLSTLVGLIDRVREHVNAIATDDLTVFYDICQIPPRSSDSAIAATLVPGDKAPVQERGRISIDVGPGERTRLLLPVRSPEEDGLHILLRTDFSEAPEPVVALRYLHDNDPEQVLIRFRQNTIVVHTELEVHMPGTSGEVFLSMWVRKGQLLVAMNGVPIYSRPAMYRSITGFVLDAIGTAGRTRLTVDFTAAAPQSSPALPWLTDSEISTIVDGRILSAAAEGPGTLTRTLHGLAGFQDSLEQDVLTGLIAQNRRTERAFSDSAETMLLARLGTSAENVTPSRPEPLLRVQDVSVRLSSNPAGKSIRALFRGERRDLISIVNNLSFDAFSGDIIGIIGKNGAGKSTFLKSLVGAIPIATGRIDAARKPILLRPGAGMQGELTGRQNLYKTGLYMDMSIDEIDFMMDDVVTFADLWDHIDRPFRYYSDGMKARLIFAMATAVPRDILLLDELLSAGDAGFQQKAVQRLEGFMSRAKLVMVVQHTFDFVLSRCTKCLLLEKGDPIFFGDPKIATEMYRERL